MKNNYILTAEYVLFFFNKLWLFISVTKIYKHGKSWLLIFVTKIYKHGKSWLLIFVTKIYKHGKKILEYNYLNEKLYRI